MGLFDAILGNANVLPIEEAQTKLDGILLDGEEVSLAYKLVRDFFVFTDLRFIMIDIQGITGKKVEYFSIPYHAISRFALETAGTLDMDAEIKIWVSSSDDPYVKTLKRGTDVRGIQRALATAVLRP